MSDHTSTIRGRDYDAMWADEYNHAADAFAYGAAAAPKVRIVDPLEIVCRSCGAQVSQRCSSMFKGKLHEQKPHYRRKADAALVQQAAMALKPGLIAHD